MADSSINSGGIGICGILFIIFLVLKLTGNIAWSWWWVTSPLWMPFAIVLVVLLLVLAGVIVHAINK